MICQWEAYLSILPSRIRAEVNRVGRTSLTELRLRLGYPPMLVMKNETICLEGTVRAEEIQSVINSASRFSPWTADTISKGYLTGPGGHRIGICGKIIRQQGITTGLRDPTMLCIRVARDFPGIAEQLKNTEGSLLIIGPKKKKKTTLLRDLIRQKSSLEKGSIGVVDERGELFPVCKEQWAYPTGKNTDVLTGFGKKEGTEMLLRTMGPRWIAVDEISSEEDCHALHKAGWCGVTLIATAHAENMEELLSRPVYKPLISHRLFTRIVCMNLDKSWHLERIGR